MLCWLCKSYGAVHSLRHQKAVNLGPPTYLHQRASANWKQPLTSVRKYHKIENHHPTSARKRQKIYNHHHLNYPPGSARSDVQKSGRNKRILDPCWKYPPLQQMACWKNWTFCQTILPICSQPSTSQTVVAPLCRQVLFLWPASKHRCIHSS